MRRLKVPGRVIGRKHALRMHIDKAGDCYHGMEDAPTTDRYPAVSKWVKTANFLRTFYNSPFKDDPKLVTGLNSNDGEIDRDGRDRAGMQVKQPELDIGHLRELTLTFLLQFAVGIKADGSATHRGGCLPIGESFGGNN